MRYVLLQVLFVLFIALFVYFLFSPYFKYFEHSEENNEELNELMSLLSKSLEFYSEDFTVYHDDYLYTAGKENKALLKISKKGEDFSVKLEKEFRTWEAVKLSNKTELCFSFFENSSCVNITEQYKAPFRTLENSVTNREWVERLFVKKYELLEEKEALHVNSVSVKKYTLGECKEFDLTYSLKKLNVDELEEIEVDPSSPLASADEINEKLCIEEDGKILYRELSFDKPFKSIQRFEMVYYSKPPEPIEYKEVSTSLSPLIRAANDFLTELKKCRDKKEDMCFRTIAINYERPEVCKETSQPVVCLDAYAAFLNDKRVCKFFEEFNATQPLFCNETNQSYDLNNTLNLSINETNTTMEG